MANIHTQERIGVFQILLVALSVYVLIALAVEAILHVDEQTRSILTHVDNAICVVFLYDFFLRLVKSENKLYFLKWGWIDLISSIPALPIFRVGRAVRVIRVLRLLRGFRSVKTIASVLFVHRARGTLATTVFLCMLMIAFSAVAILQVENTPEANIHTPDDALWWSVVTITTVGYGDKYPVSPEGRIIGAFLMLSGVGLFSVLSGAFAAWFLGGQETEREIERTDKKLSLLINEVQALRADLTESRMKHQA